MPLRVHLEEAPIGILVGVWSAPRRSFDGVAPLFSDPWKRRQ